MASIKKHTKAAKEHLDKDEEIIAVIAGGYETKMLGKDTTLKGIMLATSKRVVFFRKKVVGYTMEELQYNKINSIETGKKFLGNYINIITSGNVVKMKWIKEGEFDKFVNHLRQRIDKKDVSEKQSSSQLDIPEQIKKLSELKDQGILSDEEFELKKKELLAKL